MASSLLKMIVVSSAALLSQQTVAPPLPESTTTSEGRTEHFKRYQRGFYKKETTWALGVDLTYDGDGAVVQKVHATSAAASIPLLPGDIVQEVNRSPVGVIRNRTYELWMRYPDAAASGEVQLTIARQDRSTGAMKYFFPKVTLDAVAAGAQVAE